MNNWPNWVHHSRRVEVSGSTDGDDFTRLGEIGDIESDEPSVSLAIIFDPVTTRYLRVVIYNQLIPEGYSGAGEPAWLFVDEIVVE